MRAAPRHGGARARRRGEALGRGLGVGASIAAGAREDEQRGERGRGDEDGEEARRSRMLSGGSLRSIERPRRRHGDAVLRVPAAAEAHLVELEVGPCEVVVSRQVSRTGPQ